MYKKVQSVEYSASKPKIPTKAILKTITILRALIVTNPYLVVFFIKAFFASGLLKV